MKPPFSYYGGKQRMSSKIAPLIPQHTVYVEPFCGGATIMFAKPWPDVTNVAHYREVINDTNGHVINFFKQLKDNGKELCRTLSLTPYSEQLHKEAKDLNSGSELERAVKFFINVSQSFANILGGGWGRAVYKANGSVRWYKKVNSLPEYISRMMSTHIPQQDALMCIRQWDSPQSFFYCDPPYPETHQGHYPGFTTENFQQLVDTLDKAQGSFLLSCYEVPGITIPDGWEKFGFSSTCSASGKGESERR